MTKAEDIILKSDLTKKDKEIVLKYIQKLRGGVTDLETDAKVKTIISIYNKVTDSNLTGSKGAVKLIVQRLNEGFTVKDFETVIKTKWDAWKEDTVMRPYMRPSTLFADIHFEEYLNEKSNKYPSEWSKDYQKKLSAQEMQEWWEELRESGLQPVKNAQGFVTKWVPIVGCQH